MDVRKLFTIFLLTFGLSASAFVLPDSSRKDYLKSKEQTSHDRKSAIKQDALEKVEYTEADSVSTANLNSSYTLESIAEIASLSTLLVAIYWFFKNREKDYFLSELPGQYKIYGTLQGQEDATALHQLNIVSITRQGWFFGQVVYNELTVHGGGSAGHFSLIGKVNYSYTRLFLGHVWRLVKLKRFHPLEERNFASFHGHMHILSRNDFDVSRRNWRDFIIKDYSIIHYRNAYRFKIYDGTSKVDWLQMPDSLTLVNLTKVPDPMFG